MKILVFSDMHITPEAAYSSPMPNGMTTHLARVELTFEWIKEKIFQLNPDIVINLGDLFDTVGFVHTNALHVASDGMRKIREACDTLDSLFINVPGNHDIYAGTHMHNMSWLSYDAPSIQSFGGVIERGYKDLTFTTVSWLPPDGLKKFREDLRDGLLNTDIFFTHLPIYGAPWDVTGFDDSDKALRLDDLAGCKSPNYGEPYLFAGHYHAPYQLGTNEHIVGSVLSRNFKDVNNAIPRGMMLLDLTPRTAKMNIQRLENPYSVMFYNLKIDSIGDMDQIKDLDPDNSSVKIIYDPKLESEVELATSRFLHRILQKKLVKEQARTTEISVLGDPVQNMKTYIDKESVVEDEDPSILYELVDKVMGKFDGTTKEFRTIEFIGIEIEGFLSIDHLKYDLKQFGVVCANGVNKDDSSADNNGSGKTSALVDAPYWILTDKLLTRKGRGDAVINDHRDGGCWGKLELVVDGYPLIVERSRKHKTHGTGLKVIYDGGILTQRLDGDKQTTLDAILGEGFLDYLLQTVILREGLDNKFSKLGPTARQQLLENYIDMSPYEFFRGYIDDKHTSIDHEIGELTNKEAVLNQQMLGLRNKITGLMDKQAQIDASLARDIQGMMDMRDVHYNTILTLKGNMQDILRSRDYMDNMRDNLVNECDSLGTLLDQLQDKLRMAQARKELLEKDYSSQLKLIENGFCDRCGSDVNIGEDSLEPLILEIADIDENITSIADTIKSNSHLNTIKEGEIHDLDIDLSKVRKNIDNVRYEMEGVRASIKAIDESVSKLRSSSQVNLKDMIDEADREEQEVQHKLLQVERELAEKDHYHKHVQWWKKNLSHLGIRSFLVDQLIGRINARLSELSEKVYGPGVRVQLLSSRELKSGAKKNEIDISVQGFRKYDLASSGEKRRIDMLIQLALVDLASSMSSYKTNILIVDEILDTLDKTGIDKILSLFDELSKNKKIIVTSHNPIVSNAISEQWYFVRENNLTKLN